MTKATRVTTAAKKDMTAMMMVETREAAAIPMTPKIKASKARKPPMGWRMRI